MQVSLEHYLAKIRMSHLPTVIVEGKTDVYAMDKLIQNTATGSLRIRIDDAGKVRDQELQGLGKRMLLEALASKMTSLGIGGKSLHVLVDREFREISPSGQMVTSTSTEVVEGCIYWTWGHSIENYLVDESVVSEYFRNELSSDCAREALKTLTRTHHSMVRVSYALTKAIWGQQRPTALTNTLGPHCFDTSYQFDESRWIRQLRKQGHTETLVEELIESFRQYSREESLETSTAQWYAHGHLAFRLQAGLLQCIFVNLGEGFWEAKHLASRKEPELHMALVKAWVTCVGQGLVKYPEALIRSVTRTAV